MPENPAPVPPDDPCSGMVATYHDYVGTRIDAFLHAARYQNFAANFEPLTQCCGELRSKVDRLRPANPDADALRTFTIPTEVFDRQSACGQHPYFQDPAGGGLSPANSWFQEQKKSRSDFWLQQYTDLSEELHGCCVQHLSQCLLKGAEIRSCIEGLLPAPPPPAALPAAPVPEAAVPAVPPPAAPIAGETQVSDLFQRVYGHLAEPVSVEFPFGIIYLVAILLGLGLGWLLWHAVHRLFGPAVAEYPFLPFKWIAAAVSYPFTMFSVWRFRRGVAAEVRAQAEEAAARERAHKEEK